MECIRCGGCCQSIPCWFAQINYHLTETNSKCPDLMQNSTGQYTCKRMWKDDNFRQLMLGTGCHNPEFRKELVYAAKGE